MEKLVPPNIFLLKKEAPPGLVIKHFEFYSILIKSLKQNPPRFTINIPETIIKGFNLESSYLLHTDDGIIVYSEEISQHTILKFYKRCSYYNSSAIPFCVVKRINEQNQRFSRLVNSFSECDKYWANESSIVIQRFLNTGTEIIFKIRVTYFTTKEQFLAKLYWKDNDGTFKLSKSEEFHEEDVVVHEQLKEQMKNIREMLVGEVSNNEVVEIAAEFIQNDAGVWFFMDFLYAKMEALRKYKVSGSIEHELYESEHEETPIDLAGLQQEALRDLEALVSFNPKNKKKRKSRKK